MLYEYMQETSAHCMYHTIFIVLLYLHEPLRHVTGMAAVTTRLAPREPIIERRQHFIPLLSV